MLLLAYDYLHLVNCPEVVTISDILCTAASPAASTCGVLGLGHALGVHSAHRRLPHGLPRRGDAGEIDFRDVDIVL